jgi:hypothetical protein
MACRDVLTGRALRLPQQATSSVLRDALLLQQKQQPAAAVAALVLRRSRMWRCRRGVTQYRHIPECQ